VGKLITDAYETLAPIATLLVWADDLADDDYTDPRIKQRRVQKPV
jgi:hypothetical protein